MSNEKTIGIGIVGAGFARTTQIPGFRNCQGARVVAITSRHRAHAESVAQEFGIEHVANDWRELVERDDSRSGKRSHSSSNSHGNHARRARAPQGRALRKTDGHERG